MAEAIDRLEADHRQANQGQANQGQAGRRSADFSDLEARIAEVWAMVCEIDPEMSRLASRYADPAG